MIPPLDWCKGKSVSTEGMTMVEAFDTWVRRSPDALAVRGPDGELTYAELDAEAVRLARRLRHLGVRREDRVAIAMERSVRRIAALLAVVKAGAAYVPLDPSYPQRRLAYMLEDCEVAAQLTDRDLEQRLPPHPAPRLRPGEEDAEEQVESLALEQPLPDTLAYVCYTSGSTGQPKGVAISHRAVVGLVVGADYVDLSPRHSVLQLAPISFDAATFEVWGPLLNGGCVVVYPPGPVSLDGLARVLASSQVTTLWLTAGLFHAMVGRDPQALSGLEQLLAGGDVLSPVHVQKALEALSPAGCVINGYGPTETTTFACCHAMRGETSLEGAVPIGRPIQGTRACVVDPSLERMPVGADGELWIGGEGVARGYWRQPARTAERFVPDPWSEEPGARLYRTGDLVRWLDHGALDFLGRMDQQVKIRGFRIEPREIELALSEHPAIRDVVVRAIRPQDPEPGGDEQARLVAYLVPREDNPPTASELRSFLAARLPEHMVPAAFVALSSLPLTPNGKVDRRALPSPPRGRPDLSTAYAEPSTDEERRVAEVFGELLGRDRVGVHDDLFESGGHSLLATRILARLRELFGREVPIAPFLRSPTVAQAVRLLREDVSPASCPAPPLEPRQRPDVIPLSFPQERVWFLERLSPRSRAYNTQLTVRLRGGLEVATLYQALAEVVRRHEVLRTTFPAPQGAPRQVVHPHYQIRLPVVDLSALSTTDRHRALEHAKRRELGKAFDLERLPLVRWHLLRLGPEHSALLQVEHHFVHDGWSLARLLGEVKQLYSAFAEGVASPLPELSIQYAEYALWQRSWVKSGALEPQVEYWAQRLAGMPSGLLLPFDRRRAGEPDFRGDALAVKLPETLYEDLRRLSRRHGVSLFVTMLSGFFVLLHRVTGQTDVPVGSAFANRRLREVEPLLGMTLNMVVLRGELTGDPTFSGFLERARDILREAHVHQDVPFERVVQRLRPERTGSHNPLFQVMFSFHDSPVPALDFAGLSGTLELLQNRTAKADLDIVVVPRREQRLGDSTPAGTEPTEGALEMIWEFATDVFDRETVEELWRAYRRLLESACDDPARRLSELSMVDGPPREGLHMAVGPSVPEAPPSFTAAWTARAEEAPDAVALIAAAHSLTYDELRRRVGLRARKLAAFGVGPETRVGVIARQTFEGIVDLLAVLASGAAFVPLDPHLPAARRRRLADDAGVELILGSSDEEDLDLRGVGEAEPVGVGHGESLAYVIYTSGSTGVPKGVAVSHGAMTRHLRAAADLCMLTPTDRSLAFSLPSVDVALEQILAPLMAGAAVELRGRSLWAPEDFWSWMAERGITGADLPATYWHSVARATARRTDPVADTPLRWVSVGGEAILPVRLLEWWQGTPPGIRWLDAYGPTEAVVTATAFEPSPEDLGGAASVPIGRPTAGRRIYVLDRWGEPMPPGLAGELAVGGDLLARGYHGKPARTAEVFVPDPFAPGPGARFYRTGDLARLRRDGVVEFLGRLDQQVQVRGFRVELGEVEASLAAHPAVVKVAVQPFEHRGETLLAAYLEAAGDAPEPDELEGFLASSVPPYMIPRAWTFLDRLPLTASGKVDRRALPAPELHVAEERVAPRTETERRLAAIWSDVLEVEVWASDDFFALGGHSMLAARILSRVTLELGVEIPLRRLMSERTVAGLATAVEEARRPPASGEGELDDLLDQLENLPEDERRKLLGGTPG